MESQNPSESQLAVYVSPPFGGPEKVNIAVSLVREYLQKRGFEDALVEPMPGMGSSAGAGALGLIARILILIFRAFRWFLRVLDGVRARKNSLLVREYSRSGFIQIKHHPDLGLGALELLVALMDLEVEWRQAFPGTEVQVNFNATARSPSGMLCPEYHLNFYMSDLDPALVGKVVKILKAKSDIDALVISVDYGKATGRRIVNSSPVGGKQPWYKFWWKRLWQEV